MELYMNQLLHRRTKSLTIFRMVLGDIDGEMMPHQCAAIGSLRLTRQNYRRQKLKPRASASSIRPFFSKDMAAARHKWRVRSI